MNADLQKSDKSNRSPPPTTQDNHNNKQQALKLGFLAKWENKG